MTDSLNNLINSWIRCCIIFFPQEEKTRKEEQEAKKKADDDARKKSILSNLTFTGYKVTQYNYFWCVFGVPNIFGWVSPDTDGNQATNGAREEEEDPQRPAKGVKHWVPEGGPTQVEIGKSMSPSVDQTVDQRAYVCAYAGIRPKNWWIGYSGWSRRSLNFSTNSRSRNMRWVNDTETFEYITGQYFVLYKRITFVSFVPDTLTSLLPFIPSKQRCSM